MKSNLAFVQTPVGMIRISGTPEYITEVSFVQEPTEPTNEAAFDLIFECRDQLLAYFEGKRTVFDIPLRQTGTDFQLKVWNELSLIGFGKTISYLDNDMPMAYNRCFKQVQQSAARNGAILYLYLTKLNT